MLVVGSFVGIRQPEPQDWWTGKVIELDQSARLATVTWVDGLSVGQTAEINSTNEIKFT